MSAKKIFWLLVTLNLTIVCHAEAQQPAKLPRMGLLGSTLAILIPYTV